MTNIFRSPRALLWINSAVYLGFGLTFLASPTSVAGELGIELTNTTALADLRAIYGGLPIGVALTMLAGLWRNAWLPATVALTGLCSLEASLARLFSWVVSGAPSTLILGFMVLEFLGFLWALACYRSIHATRDEVVSGGLQQVRV